MRLSRLIAGLVLVAVPAGIATTVSAANPEEAFEIARIRAHFDSVLTELRWQNASALTTEQRRNRAQLEITLEAYRNRGVFPHNYDFAERATPYFVDRKTGTLCAVAHLLASTGRRDIVDRVASTNNNAWVAQLAGDSAFTQWLDVNGLTLDEAARIQFPYSVTVSPTQRARNEVFMGVAPFAIGGAVLAGGWNALLNGDGHRRAVSWTGMAMGVASATAGIALMTGSSPSKDVFGMGVTSLAVGGLSMIASTHSIVRHRNIVNAERETERKRAVAEASFAPIVGVSGESRPTVGASLSVRF